jgi:hypothetical protein
MASVDAKEKLQTALAISIHREHSERDFCACPQKIKHLNRADKVIDHLPDYLIEELSVALEHFTK